jgi:hypothetical protein
VEKTGLSGKGTKSTQTAHLEGCIDYNDDPTRRLGAHCADKGSRGCEVSNAHKAQLMV